MDDPRDIAVLVRRAPTLVEAAVIVKAAQNQQREELAEWLENPRMTRAEMVAHLRAHG